MIGSAIPDLKSSGKFLTDLKINIAVEIGTAWGISTAHIAQYCNKIYTFDIQTYPLRKVIWDTLNVSDKIIYNLVKGRSDTEKILRKVDYDFAFIDGRHEVEEVRKDFRLVRKCGRVLFHDVDLERYPDNHRFLMKIGGKMIYNNLGYWEKNG